MALPGSDCVGARACDAPTDDSDGNFAIDAIDLRSQNDLSSSAAVNSWRQTPDAVRRSIQVQTSDRQSARRRQRRDGSEPGVWSGLIKPAIVGRVATTTILTRWACTSKHGRSEQNGHPIRSILGQFSMLARKAWRPTANTAYKRPLT
jgi:hypothetical protein